MEANARPIAQSRARFSSCADRYQGRLWVHPAEPCVAPRFGIGAVSRRPGLDDGRRSFDRGDGSYSTVAAVSPLHPLKLTYGASRYYQRRLEGVGCGAALHGGPARAGCKASVKRCRLCENSVPGLARDEGNVMRAAIFRSGDIVVGHNCRSATRYGPGTGPYPGLWDLRFRLACSWDCSTPSADPGGWPPAVRIRANRATRQPRPASLPNGPHLLPLVARNHLYAHCKMLSQREGITE